MRSEKMDPPLPQPKYPHLNYELIIDSDFKQTEQIIPDLIYTAPSCYKSIQLKLR